MDIHAVKERHKQSLMDLPNVVGVGIGPKTRGGHATGETAVKVFVSRKVRREELAEEERIPERLEGFPTDVELMGPLTAGQNRQEL